jgi:hypothetical protein
MRGEGLAVWTSGSAVLGVKASWDCLVMFPGEISALCTPCVADPRWSGR